MTTLDELERLAKAASSGPWTVDERFEAGCVRGRYGDIIVMETELLSDAAFIAAANSETILALLSERAELLAAVERMRAVESSQKPVPMTAQDLADHAADAFDNALPDDALPHEVGRAWKAVGERLAAILAERAKE